MNHRTAGILGIFLPLAAAAIVLSSQAETNFVYEISGTNLWLRFRLPEDRTNFFTLDQGATIDSLRPQFTSLGGGSNSWRYLVLTPNREGNGRFEFPATENGWDFSTPRLGDFSRFWQVRTKESAAEDYLNFAYESAGTNLSVHFSLKPDLANYYALEAGTNFYDLGPRAMAFGGGTNYWSLSLSTVQTPRQIWNVRRLPATIPLDSDGDGMDDMFELTHGLNPLDPTDGASDSGLEDLEHKRLNWLEAYRFYFVRNIKIYDSISREVSAFNFGQATANYEALSREVSTFNFGQPAANYEAISRETTVFNTPGDANLDGINDLFAINHGLGPNSANQLSGFTEDNPNNTGRALTWLELYHAQFGVNAKLYESVSREVSVFNFGQTASNFEAVSREISVFNVPVPDSNGDGINDVFARNHGIAAASDLSGFTEDFPNNAGRMLTWLETYRSFFGQTPLLYEAVSREVSVFNFGQPTANLEAVSREVSVFNIP